MTKEDAMIKLIAAIEQECDSTSDPASDDYHKTHAVFVYSDGEIAMTKAGPLYGQRRLHMISSPLSMDPIPVLHDAMKKMAHSIITVSGTEYVRVLLKNMDPVTDAALDFMEAK